nr:hypothetical protein [Pseudomonas sp. FSL R10-2172]
MESARDLDEIISSAFSPESVFRIDHYLGKETVQNIMAFRFANQIFEPIWNNHYVSAKRNGYSKSARRSGWRTGTP